MFSYSVGAVSYLVQRLDSDETRRRLDAVSRWGKFRRAPLPLVTRIRQHFIYSYDRQRLSVEETKILRELSPSLKRLLAQVSEFPVLLFFFLGGGLLRCCFSVVESSLCLFLERSG